MFNQFMGDIASGGANPIALRSCLSKEDSVGNGAVSIFLEWSTDKDAANANASSDVATYGWATGEKWQLGSMFVGDINPGSTDVPVIAHSPQTDTQPVSTNTGASQLINITTAGRAGYARLKTSYQEGAGTPNMLAHNQFWPVTIMID